MAASHINSYNFAMCQSIIPGSHCMVSIDGRIEELCNISSSIDTGHVRFQVLVHNNAIAHLNRSFLQHLRIECNTQTNTDHIYLDLASLLGLDIAWNSISRNDG